MDIQTITVVGAGNMGSGIAQAFAQGGFEVRLNDVNMEAIQRGLDRIEGPLRKRVEAGKMKANAVDGIMARLTPEADLEAAVKDADMVVEAVFEDLQVKQDLFAKLDGVCPEKTILATNTSSFYVKDLAAATGRADHVVGLHFFFPAAINKLVEVVKGPDTSQASFDATFEAVKRAGKIAIETSDAPGFCVNRFFVPWINESCRLLDEGVADVATIEAAAKQAFQIGMGPFQLMNVTGVPISLHAQSTLHEQLGPFYEPSAALRTQVEAGENWDLSGEPDAGKFEAVASRLRGVVYGIACHLVQEGVASIRDTDRGATIGLRWAAGPFAMMNAQGLNAALADVQEVAARWEDGFAVPQSLSDHVATGTTWHLPTVVHDFLDDGRIAIIRFDRPEALNALAPPVLHDLDACLDAIEEAGSVRAILVTGEGKAFIAGADIPTMASLDAKGAREYTELGNRVLSRLAGQACPVIMAINGFALGGGLELALTGDLLYASDRAQLGLPEVGLGIHPGFGGTQRLPRRIGIGPAKELTFTGRQLRASEAAELGLVDGVVPHADLMDHCLGVARTIAEKAPLAVAGAKNSIDRGMGQDLAGGLSVEQESVVLLFASSDKDEGLKAFMERRAPRFEGR